MSRRAVSVTLSDAERVALHRMVKAPTATQRQVWRARVILLAAEGKENKTIAEVIGRSVRSVALWRGRFAKERLAGLETRPKRRTPIKYTAEDRRRVVEVACTGTPEGETHWSVRTLAQATGVGRETVRAVLREAGLRPHRMGTFSRSTTRSFGRS